MKKLILKFRCKQLREEGSGPKVKIAKFQQAFFQSQIPNRNFSSFKIHSSLKGRGHFERGNLCQKELTLPHTMKSIFNLFFTLVFPVSQKYSSRLISRKIAKDRETDYLLCSLKKFSRDLFVKSALSSPSADETQILQCTFKKVKINLQNFKIKEIEKMNYKAHLRDYFSSHAK